MARENLKLISVKIEPETLAKLERFKAMHPYWKRNALINGILTSVVDTFSDEEIYDMVRYVRNSDYDTEGSFKLWVPNKK